MARKIIDLRNRVVDKNLTFDENTHTYCYKGKILKSVTTLLSEVGISPSYDSVNEELLTKSKDRGNKIHKDIENFIKKGIVADTKELHNFINFITDNDYGIIGCEYIVFSEVDGIAGKVDLLLIDKEGNIVICDIKTTSIIHVDSVSWQLSIYDYLDEGIIASKGLCIHFDKEGNIDTKEIKLKPYDSIYQLVLTERKPIVSVDETKLAKVYQALVSIDNLKEQIKGLQSVVDDFNETLIKTMEEKGVKKFDNDQLSITYVAPFEKETIDSAKLKKEQPELVKQYLKKSITKASVRITLKKENDE